MRILIVEHCAPLRRLLSEFLEAHPGVEVVGEACNSAEAIGLMMSLSPDLVLMGLGMPGKDGYEATEVIKTRWPQTRVVILSDHLSDAYRQAARAVHADDYIEKRSMKTPLANVLSRVHLSSEAA